MKKIKNRALIILILCIVVFSASTVLYRFLQDENKLTLTEKNYITKNHSNLINVNVLNDSNIFGSSGSGVFYDFLSFFEKERDLKVNRVTQNYNEQIDGLSLTKGSTLPSNAHLIYTDHYVLVGKKYNSFTNLKDIKDNIGVLSKDLSVINKYLSNNNLTITNFDDKSALLDAFSNDSVKYIIVPEIEYLDVILDGLYSICYHINDIKDYYYINPSSDNVLYSLFKKTYNIWQKENFQKSFNTSEYKLFTSNLKITEKELDVINSKEYNYGFITNYPYEIKSSDTYGGIIGTYLKKFSQFSNITIKYKNYNNISSLQKDINKNKVDLYINYGGITSSFVPVEFLLKPSISFVGNLNDDRVFNSLEALKELTIYTKANSVIENYLKNSGINCKSYKNENEINKILNEKNIVAMDSYNYLVYSENNPNTIERLRINPNINYNFYSSCDTMFNRLLYYYINSMDPQVLAITGYRNYKSTMQAGKLIAKIAKFALILVAIIIILSFVLYKYGKKVHIQKRIKKNDKMKYIDILTSLKNRNFLKENIPLWNQNTVYPQAIVLIDLNSIQELNDRLGYAEGDKQIQAMANILIKTQLDNTEIMRTDGNEFTIYLLGYSEKQILSYIKKLNKEIKNLPHDRGAAIGFSIINDDLKLIEDAINEATEVMKKNKDLFIEEPDNEETKEI